MSSLTPRETECATHILAGLCDKQIAREMGVSLRTVKAYKTMVYVKSGVSDKVSFILKCFLSVVSITPSELVSSALGSNHA